MSINWNTHAGNVINAIGEPVTYVQNTGAKHLIKAVIARQYDQFNQRTGEAGLQVSLTRASAPFLRRGEQIITENKVAYEIEDVLDDDGHVITASIANV